MIGKSFEFNVESSSALQTENIGSSLGRLLKGKEIIALKGDIGAGKTCFTRGLAIGMGIDGREVASPTFVLAHFYEGKISMYHVDLYRLISEKEIELAGIFEYFKEDAVVVIEWPEIMTSLNEFDRIEIEIIKINDDERNINIASYGEANIELVERLKTNDFSD